MPGSIADVTALAGRLDAARLSYELSIIRSESVLFSVAVPGERWEIELMIDGSTEVEVFRSNGEILDAASLDALFQHGS